MPTDSDPGKVPPGKVTAFDRGQYDNLIAWVDSVDEDLNKNLAKPKAGVRLDATLGSGIFPGSANWPPAALLVTNGKAFGTSVAARYADLSKDWEQFVTALRNARDVFENTNDLVNYDASKFVNEFPGVIQPGSSGANGSPPPGGSGTNGPTSA
jgi:hypothetical protein